MKVHFENESNNSFINIISERLTEKSNKKEFFGESLIRNPEFLNHIKTMHLENDVKEKIILLLLENMIKNDNSFSSALDTKSSSINNNPEEAEKVERASDEDSSCEEAENENNDENLNFHSQIDNTFHHHIYEFNVKISLKTFRPSQINHHQIKKMKH